MFNLKKLLLNESPITSYQTIGDFSKGSSFRKKVDRALVTHPTSIQKVKDFFKTPNTDFDFYFVNTKDAKKFEEMGKVTPDFLWNELKITPDQLKDGKIDKYAVTIFFTNNNATQHAPLTPWLMAHRFGHVMRRAHAWDKELSPWINEMLDGMLSDYGFTVPSKYPMDDAGYQTRRKYDIAKRHLCETIGTFKSARDKNLRDEGEFQYELFAQFIKDGLIVLNPLPKKLLVSHKWGRPQYNSLINTEDNYWSQLQNDFPYYANAVLSEAEGKIWVM